jgi:hypothetical protein
VNLVVSNYLDGLIDALGARSFQTAEQRLARMLVVSARQLGRTGRGGIELDLTNEQLAVTANVTVFTASRKLSKWQDLGILKKHRGKIVLRSLSPFERSLRILGDKSRLHSKSINERYRRLHSQPSSCCNRPISTTPASRV